MKTNFIQFKLSPLTADAVQPSVRIGIGLRHLGNAQSPYGKARSFFRRNSAGSGHGHTQPKDGESLVATFYSCFSPRYPQTRWGDLSRNAYAALGVEPVACSSRVDNDDTLFTAT
jgi:hypothetical protein